MADRFLYRDLNHVRFIYIPFGIIFLKIKILFINLNINQHVYSKQKKRHVSIHNHEIMIFIECLLFIITAVSACVVLLNKH